MSMIERMASMEAVSSHPKGSLGWFIDQYGVILPKEFTCKSKQGSNDFYDKKVDYSEKIAECAEKGKKVYGTYGGFLTCCDEEKAFIIHDAPGIKDILKEEGYVDPELGGLNDWQQPDYVSRPGSIGNWTLSADGSKIYSDFSFGNLQQDTEFNVQLARALRSNAEQNIAKYKAYKQAELDASSKQPQ